MFMIFWKRVWPDTQFVRLLESENDYETQIFGFFKFWHGFSVSDSYRWISCKCRGKSIGIKGCAMKDGSLKNWNKWRLKVNGLLGDANQTLNFIKQFTICLE